MSGSQEEVKQHVATYKKVAGALAVLTIVTVLASYLPTPVSLGIVIALIIASIKGSLVASFFMHLVHERSMALVLTGAMMVVFWIALMFLPLLGQADNIGVHKTLPNANAPAAEEAH
jgi:cytochrome c oxidase subunit 4